MACCFAKAKTLFINSPFYFRRRNFAGNMSLVYVVSTREYRNGFNTINPINLEALEGQSLDT